MGLKNIENLISDLTHKSEELAQLYNFIDKNQASFGPSSQAALQLFSANIQKVDSIILSSKTLLESESKLLTIAYLRLSEDVPEITTKIREPVAKGAPKSLMIEKPKEAKEDLISNGLIQVLTSTENKNESLKIFNSLIANVKSDSISGNGAIALIEVLLTKGDNLGEYDVGRYITWTHDNKVNNIDFRIQLLYNLLGAINPKNDFSTNQKILNLLSKLIQNYSFYSFRNLPQSDKVEYEKYQNLYMSYVNGRLSKFVTVEKSND